MVTGVKIPGTANEDGQEEVLDLSQLKSDISRKFGQKMGIRNASKMKGEKIYFLMAARINNNEEFDNSTSADIAAKEQNFTEHHQRYNTVLRLINALFSKEFLPQFLVWKDVVVQRKGRTKEAAIDNINAKNLFEDVAKVLFADIDTPSSEGCGHLETFDNLEEANLEVIYSYKSLCKLGETPFVELDPKQLEDTATRLVKSRLWILDTLKERSVGSSTSKNDTWLYVYEALKATISVRTIGKFPLYYFCLKAAGITQFDSHLHSIGYKTTGRLSTSPARPMATSQNSAARDSTSSIARTSLSNLASAAATEGSHRSTANEQTAMSVDGKDTDEKLLQAVVDVASSLKAWSQSTVRVNTEQLKLHQASLELQQIEIRRQRGAEIDELYARLDKIKKDQHLRQDLRKRMVEQLKTQLEEKMNDFYPEPIQLL